MPFDALSGRVVVVTGATSGIGRETATQLSARGCRVVLVARRADVLQAFEEELARRGGEALAVPADMADADAVQAVVDRALERFGRIDAWVNNAAVLSAGRFVDTPPDVFRQVIETNLFGYVNGARAALPVFIDQGSGVLINNASVLGAVGVAFLSAYVASKFAIRGFSESLRQEFLDGPIEVCTIMPSTIGTAIWSHAANFTGQQLRPVPPVFKPSDVAEAIVGCIEKPRPEVIVGWTGYVMKLGHLAPRTVFDFVARRLAPLALAPTSAAATVGNVFAGMGPASIAGDLLRFPANVVRHLTAVAERDES